MSATKTPKEPETAMVMMDKGHGDVDKGKETKQAVASPKLVVMCLHGYRQSGALLAKQMKQMDRAGAKRGIQFVYPDAPFRHADSSQEEPLYQWFSASKETMLASEHKFDTAEASLAMICEKLDEVAATMKVPLGVLGYSQGAAVAQVLIATGALQKRPVRFVVLAGAFPVNDPAYSHELAKLAPIRGVRSLHFIGSKDTLVPAVQSMSVAKLFDAPVIYAHDGGHYVPSNRAASDRFFSFALDE